MIALALRGKRVNRLICRAVLLLALVVPGPAMAIQVDRVGLHSAVRAIDRPDAFYQMEAVAAWAPKELQFGHGAARGEVDLLATVGVMNSVGRAGVIVSSGVAVRLYPFGPLFVDLGFRPALLSRHRFGRLDLGYPVQFISHIGGGVRVASAWLISYRIQHTSNAGLADTNPGINLTTIQLLHDW